MSKSILGALACAAVFVAGCRGGGDHTSAAAESAITISPASGPLTDATAGVAYSVTFTATGGALPYTWTVVGIDAALASLTLDPSTGTLSGAPAAVTTDAAITIQVADASTPSLTASATYTLTVGPEATSPSISSPAAGALAPDATAGVAYSVTLTATGGTAPYAWSIVSADAALGALALDASSGTLAGVPMTVTSAAAITIEVTDLAGSTAMASYTLSVDGPVISPAAGALTPGAIVGMLTATTFTASGGTGPYTWAITGGAAPGGLSLDPGLGTLSGIPDAPTTAAAFTVTVADANGIQASAEFTLDATLASGALYVSNLQDQSGTLSQAELALDRFDDASAASGTATGTAVIAAGVISGSAGDGLVVGFEIAQLAVDPFRDLVWVTAGANAASPGVFAYEKASTASGATVVASPTFAFSGAVFNNPIGVATDQQRAMLYVTDAGNQSLLVFSVTQTSSTPAATITGFTAVRQIYLDQVNDALYVIEAGDGSTIAPEVDVFSPASGLTTSTVASALARAITSASFDQNLMTVVADPVRDVLYVGDDGLAATTSTAAIWIFSGQGATTTLAGSAAPDAQITSATIPGLAIDGTTGPTIVLFQFDVDLQRDELYVVDPIGDPGRSVPPQVLVFSSASTVTDPATASRTIQTATGSGFTLHADAPPDTIVFDEAH